MDEMEFPQFDHPVPDPDGNNAAQLDELMGAMFAEGWTLDEIIARVTSSYGLAEDGE
jgi:hypothetical protein